MKDDLSACPLYMAPCSYRRGAPRGISTTPPPLPCWNMGCGRFCCRASGGRPAGRSPGHNCAKNGRRLRMTISKTTIAFMTPWRALSRGGQTLRLRADHGQAGIPVPSSIKATRAKNDIRSQDDITARLYAGRWRAATFLRRKELYLTLARASSLSLGAVWFSAPPFFFLLRRRYNIILRCALAAYWAQTATPRASFYDVRRATCRTRTISTNAAFVLRTDGTTAAGDARRSAALRASGWLATYCGWRFGGVGGSRRGLCGEGGHHSLISSWRITWRRTAAASLRRCGDFRVSFCHLAGVLSRLLRPVCLGGRQCRCIARAHAVVSAASFVTATLPYISSAC